MANYYHPLHLATLEALKFEGADLDIAGKSKSLRKFGRRTDVGTTPVTVGAFGGESHETYLNTNGITHIISTSASDTETVKVEYHTVSGGDFTFGVQSVTLTGQTGVALPVPCARVSRIYNDDSTELVGLVSVYEGGATSGGVVTDATEIHAQIPAGSQSTFKTATTISSVDYYLLTEFHANLEGSNTARVELDLQIREGGKVFRHAFEAGLGTSGSTGIIIRMDPVIIVKANSDIRVLAVSTATSTTVSAYYAGYLASIVT